ncbi:protoporphyrinogen/coproporphyrinogen oxidase [Gulosibacter bifidus]|uniref:Protoporphyrinogen/coproporphyrinogen oxidase n=1 Tax=Gulosibacter bifidus TaxID=272239 RepID=A0ABW5RJQ9_9MICO|nr:FAD-dependent oxidoreductase [Gulosibacter bifidus]
MRRVDVIGAGPAGLVAARCAAQLGARVRVFEAGQIGGMIQPATLRAGGDTDGAVTIDIGAEAFAVRGGAVATLIDELGLSGDVVAPRALGSWGYADGRAYPMPKGGLIGIPSDPDDVRHVLTAAGTASVAAESTLDATVGADATTLAEFVRARFGDEVLERLVAPVSRGVYSIDPEDVDLNAVLPGIAEQVREHGSVAAVIRHRRAQATPGALVNTVRGGMNRVIAALAAQCRELGVEICEGRAATSLAGDGSADAVIVTVAPSPSFPWLRELQIASGIAASTDAIDAAQLAASDTVAAEVVALLLDAPELDAYPRGTGLLVASGTGTDRQVRAKALTHASAKWEWLQDAAAGRHVVRLSYGPQPGQSTAAEPQTTSMSDADVARLALADASELLGVRLSDAHLLDLGRRVWRMPAPPTRLGRAALLEQVRRAVGGQGAAAHPRVHVCGTWIDGTGLATVVPAAIAAAEAALR